jgi:hypothetical protein
MFHVSEADAVLMASPFLRLGLAGSKANRLEAITY